MVKILSGLVAAIVIAVGGFFGFQSYTQHRIASEVEAALEQIRATGGKASHGKISFDLLSRTVRIADLAVPAPAAACSGAASCWNASGNWSNWKKAAGLRHRALNPLPAPCWRRTVRRDCIPRYPTFRS